MDLALKRRSVALLVVAQIMAMGLWFVSAAILSELQATTSLGPFMSAWLSSAVPAGFVVGAMFVAISGIADRLDPRHVFVASALLGALFNVCVLALPAGSVGAVLLRFLTGFTLAGVYPVGMKIMVGWGTHDRGLLVGLLVGGLTWFRIAALTCLVGWRRVAAYGYRSIGVSGFGRATRVVHTARA